MAGSCSIIHTFTRICHHSLDLFFNNPTIDKFHNPRTVHSRTKKLDKRKFRETPQTSKRIPLHPLMKKKHQTEMNLRVVVKIVTWLLLNGYLCSLAAEQERDMIGSGS